MKDSIGGLWLLGIIMVFMVLMITFVSLSLNYSTVFRLKSEMLSTIEECQGFNDQAKNKISGLINEYGYNHKKTCSFSEKSSNSASTYSRMIGIDVDDPKVYVDNYNKKFSYCVIRQKNKRVKASKIGIVGSVSGDNQEYFYVVELAFGFNLPVMGDIFTFRITGETRGILYAEEGSFASKFD